jgi:hypothetical protein
MNEKIIPSADTLAAHEQAAAEITELRRKGIHCHIEEHSHTLGHHLGVVQDGDEPVENPPPPVRTMKGSRASSGGIEA